MAASQSVKNHAKVVEKVVTLAATSGTAVGPAIPAGTVVLSAGIEVLQAVPSVTTYTVNITDGTTTFGSALNINNTAAGTIRAGFTAGLAAVNETVDAVTTISGTPGTIRARIWAVVADVNNEFTAPGIVDREQLA